MDGNFLVANENVEIRTVSYDNGHSTDGSSVGQHETKSSVYNKLSRLLLKVGVFMLPLFFLPWSSGVLELNKQMLLLVLSSAVLILWLLNVVTSGKLSWRSSPLDMGVSAVLLSSILATIFSAAKFRSLFGLSNGLSSSLVSVIALSIFFFALVNVFEDKGKVIRKVLNWSLLIAILYGVLNILGVGLFKYLHLSFLSFAATNSFNTIGSLNSLGIVAAASLPLFYKSDASIWKFLSVRRVGLILALVVIVIINWWVVWAVAVAGMVTMIALDSLNNKGGSEAGSGRLKVSRFIFPMTVIVLGVFLVVVNFSFNPVKKNLPVEVAPSFSLSTTITKDILKKNMVFGNGPENFSLAFDKYGAKMISDTSLFNVKFFDAKSEIFNYAVGGGVVAILAIAFLLWLLTKEVLSQHKNGEVLSDGGNVATFSVMAALVVAMFLYPFSMSLMFLLYTIMGLTILATRGGSKKTFDVEERVSTSLISSLGFVAGLILVLVGLYFGASRYVSDLKYAQALYSTDTESAVNLLVEAINWNSQDDRYYQAASQGALTLLSKELNTEDDKNANKSANVQNYTVSAINLARRATEVGPYESSNWTNLAAVYQNLLLLVGGVDKLSEDSSLKAAELRPGDPSFFNAIGSMYMAKADVAKGLATNGGENVTKLQETVTDSLTKAEEYFKKAIEVSPNFGLAIYNLASVYDRMDKLDDAIAQLEKVAPYNSNQPTIAFELGLLYYRNGQKDKALKQLQETILLAPNFSNARWYLGLSYEEAGNIPAAIEQMEKILSIKENKDNKDVQTKLENLRNGVKADPPQKVMDHKPL